MSLDIGNINAYDSNIDIKGAWHLLDNRETKKGTSKHHRGMHINKPRYLEIIKRALKKGLSTYRNKGPAVIIFKSKKKVYGILVDLSDNELFIITIFRGPLYMSIHSVFVKVHNRIYLGNDFLMKEMNISEKNIAKETKNTLLIDEECKLDDKLFKSAMSHISDLTLLN